MDIDFDKIEKIYGEEIIEKIRDNEEDVNENILYLRSKGFEDIGDILERYTLIFINNPLDFKKKIDNLIGAIGNDYLNILETNMELWGKVE